MRTIIENVHILTMDMQGKSYKEGVIVIEGDTMLYVGEKENLPAALLEPAIIYNGKGMAALPGFINAHTHTAMSLFRGHANDLPLWEWLSVKIWPLEDKMTGRDAYWLSLLGMAEMLAAGVTTFADMYMFMHETAKAVAQSGMRAVLARGLQGPDTNTVQRHLEVEELSTLQGSSHGRIGMMIAPHAIYTCTPEYLIDCARMAEHYGVGLHIHLSETEKEVSDSLRLYGRTPVAHLKALGLFDAPLLAAHCVHLTEEDIGILAEHSVRVVHCPASNLKLSSGIAPLDRLLKAGISVALGTDGAASNNNLSIFKEMNLATLLIKGCTKDPTLLPAKEALTMATRSGAYALGLESTVGFLAAGMKADIILIDTHKPHYYPQSDLTTNLVYSGYSGDVHTVWINGRMVYEGGQYKTMDIERIYAEVDKIYTRVIK